MIRGRAGTMTHDYKRDGTTDLFAALNIAAGEVIVACRKQHTAADVLAFFKTIDRSVPRSQDIHVVLDNLSAHKAPEIRDWLAHPRRARWHLRLTPTSSSWLNLVQRWFKELTDRRGAGAPSPACPPSSKPSKRGSATATRTHSHSSGTPQPAKPPRKSCRGRTTLSQVKSTTRHQGQLAGWVQVGTRGTLLNQRPNRGGVHCESVPMANGNRRPAAAPGSRTHAHPERAASSIGRRSGRAPAMPAYLTPSARDGPPAPRPPPRGLDRRAWRRTARRRPLRPPREPGPDGPPLPRP